jgi:hypothetical protein
MPIFKGRQRVRYDYSRWGYTRGNGKTWHGGIDIEGLDSTTILMPDYNGKEISGKVLAATRIYDTNNKTWEWGWYICVQLDANQTPDAVNYLYFCHNARNLAKVGQKVKTGDILAEMGNTGNAAQANPPYAHCHFEVRAKRTGAGLDPTAYVGHANAAGTYGEEPEKKHKATVLVNGLRLRAYPEAEAESVQLDLLSKGAAYEVVQTKNKWAFLKTGENSGGWACIENAEGEYLKISEV